MKGFLQVICMLCLSLTAQAVEVGGVRLEDGAHLGNKNLVLNGAGVRSKFIFDLYIAALYLGAKKSTAEAVLSDTGEKRLALHLLRDINAKSLLFAFKKAINDNHTRAQSKAIEEQRLQFEAIFLQIAEFRKGDVITMDYQADIGTLITVNGGVRGAIPGAEFYVALLEIWLGEKPAQADLKLKLLGGE